MARSPRDIFNDVMRFRCPGRTLATLGGIWPSTLDRWVSEGMPPELKEMPRMLEYFDLDPHIWSGPAAELFVHPPFERKVLRQSADTVTYVNHLGIVCTELAKDHFKSMPHFEEFPVRTRADWREYRKRLEWSPERVGEKWAAQKAKWAKRDAALIIALNRGASLYGALREMMGVEALSIAFYDDRPLVSEMMDTMVELFLHCVEALFRDFVPDAVCLWEDMAYKNGPLLSPRLVREMMLPRYCVMTRKLRELGIPIILLDSDGDISQLIPIWLEAGIDGVVPMEAQAGMDVARYREMYPRLLMMGGVDKKALAAGREAIDAEIDKIRRTIASGGLIPFFDHGLPHDASYANFLYFVERLKEVARG
jgi:hypothetical protein